MADDIVLQSALEYLRRGFSIVHMCVAKKAPTHKWKHLQRRRLSEAEVRSLFRREGGVGVIFGEISGGLVSRDFDTLAAYEAWAAEHPELAATLPTVETSRGRHVYCRANPVAVNELRARLGKEGGIGAIKLADGELRCGVGCYSVLPPSRHPSGQVYRWLVPLPTGPVPEVDLQAAGFVPTELVATESDREHGGVPKTTETPHHTLSPHGSVDSVLSAPLCCTEPTDSLEARIDRAIRESLPTGPGKRNQQVFEFARALKAIPALADAPVKELRDLVRRWHSMALPAIATTPFEESWIDFLHAWPRVKFPKGTEPIAQLFEAAKSAATPEAAWEYQPAVQLLVKLCRELQRAAGEQPFFLSCRTACKLLGVEHSTAARWLFLLVHDGFLKEVTKGSKQSGRASRYRYIEGYAKAAD